MNLRLTLCAAWTVCALALSSSSVLAQTPGDVSPAWKRSNYSLPWGLRPGIAPNLVRLDTVYANHAGGGTVASILTAGYRPVPSVQSLGFYVRAAVNVNAPVNGSTVVAASNPLLMAIWTPEVAPNVRLNAFGGLTIPVGMGGGDSPDTGARAAVLAGIQARSGLDNALFAMNYITPVAGAGLTWTARGLTVQAEATVLQLVRVRGESVDADATRTNFTTGLHVGYRLIPHLTASVEARYQRWLSTPAAVAASPDARDQFTATAGLRANVPVSHAAILRPGVAFTVPVGGVMAARDYWVLQLDVPFAF